MKVHLRLGVLLLGMGILFMTLTRQNVSAAESGILLTLGYDCSDVKFRVYRFADENRELTEKFEGYPVSFACSNNAQWLALAITLSGYVSRDQIVPEAESVTASGKTLFHDLKPGWYLVEGDASVQDGVIQTPVPFVLNLNENTPVEIAVKWDEKEDSGGELWDCMVKKVWKDAGRESSRPRQIQVQLLKDQEVYDIVSLNAGNRWEHRWEDLDPEYRWMVVEEQVPAGYTVAVTQEDCLFTITNTRTGSENSPDGSGGDGGSSGSGSTTDNRAVPQLITLPDEAIPLTTVTIEEAPVPLAPLLPQTGQLWWPVPWLVLSGCFCIAAGVSNEKKRSRGYEK